MYRRYSVEVKPTNHSDSFKTDLTGQSYQPSERGNSDDMLECQLVWETLIEDPTE